MLCTIKNLTDQHLCEYSTDERHIRGFEPGIGRGEARAHGALGHGGGGGGLRKLDAVRCPARDQLGPVDRRGRGGPARVLPDRAASLRGPS